MGEKMQETAAIVHDQDGAVNRRAPDGVDLTAMSPTAGSGGGSSGAGETTSSQPRRTTTKRSASAVRATVTIGDPPPGPKVPGLAPTRSETGSRAYSPRSGSYSRPCLGCCIPQTTRHRVDHVGAGTIVAHLVYVVHRHPALPQRLLLVSCCDRIETPPVLAAPGANSRRTRLQFGTDLPYRTSSWPAMGQRWFRMDAIDRKREIEEQLLKESDREVARATILLISALGEGVLTAYVSAEQRSEWSAAVRRALQTRAVPLSFQHHRVAQLLAELLEAEMEIAAEGQ